MKKKRKHTGLWILLAVIVILGALALWQRNNIRAAVQGLRYSPEELQQQLSDSQQHSVETVQESYGLTIRDLTTEEKTALKEGTLSREEIIARLAGLPVPGQAEAQTPAETEQTAQQEQPPADNSAAAGEKYKNDLSALIAEVYVMQSEYSAALDDMVEEAKAEYSAKSDAERTRSALLKWAGGYVSRASALEKECDAKMDSIIAEMLALLKENGEDKTLVDEIIYTYAQEKSLKKSLYLSELQKRGLLA